MKTKVDRWIFGLLQGVNFWSAVKPVEGSSRFSIVGCAVLLSIAFATGCAGVLRSPAFQSTPQTAPSTVFAELEAGDLCALFADQVGKREDGTGDMLASESAGDWRTERDPDPFDFIEFDIDHDGVDDLIYRLHHSRSAQPPVFVVEYDILFYRFSVGAPVKHDLSEVLKPRDEGGAFTRLEMDLLQGGPRPFKLPDTVRMYGASIVKLNELSYIVLTSPPSGTVGAPSLYLIDFESRQPYVACRVAAAS